VDELRRQVASRPRRGLIGQFALAQRRAAHALSEADERLLRELAAGPQSLVALAGRMRHGPLGVQRIEELEIRRLTLRSGFTPTDALHVLGRFEHWETTASRLGAELLAVQMGLSTESFCELVISGVSDRVTTALVSKVLGDEAALPDGERKSSSDPLLARALGNVPASDLDCRLGLRRPVVAVGAPVEAYMPRVVQQLHTELVIPHHTGVANAVGAVAGGVVLQRRVLIRPVDLDHHFRLHLPDGVRDVSSVEEGVAYAREMVAAELSVLARQAGAGQAEVRMARVDRSVPVKGGWGQSVYLETELTFTAVGRPRLTEESAGSTNGSLFAE
jgi:N-methylhydantoinase A/oxoprolinase/acetone carboxylase beta subunit